MSIWKISIGECSFESIEILLEESKNEKYFERTS